MPEGMTNPLSREIEGLRRKLLETSKRNRLINVNRKNQRANCLNVINEKSDEIYRLLRMKQKTMRFKAMGKDKTEDSQGVLLAAPETDIPSDSARFTDNLIETPLGPEQQARRLLRLYREARTAEEETGVNILYLAMGFLTWTESPSSAKKYEAPLILLPVQLKRNKKTSTYDIECRDDDITTNLSLQERLRQDFGITLPDIDDSEEWIPSQYFAKVKDAISSQRDWSLDEDGMQIGFFSFAKLLMYRDLEFHNWTDGSLVDNPLFEGILTEGFPRGQSIFDDEDNLDDFFKDPAKIIQVTDADASQTKVIEEVRAGSNLVVQGPPGTGKSQTITNIIASAVHDGKTVLFVAEKMAALSVVHTRLQQAGLSDICLEIYSHKANKKALYEKLKQTLENSDQKLPPIKDAKALRDSRNELNRISKLLHTPVLDDTEDTPFGSISTIIGFRGQGVAPPSINRTGLEKIGREKRVLAAQAITDFIKALERVGDPQQHPFCGVTNLDVQPTDLDRLERDLTQAIEALDNLIAEAGRIADLLKQNRPEYFADIKQICRGLRFLATAPKQTVSFAPVLWDFIGESRPLEALEAGAKWRQAKDKIESHFIDAAWDADVAPIRTALAKGQVSWLSRIFGKYRQASGELAGLLSGALPRTPAERLKYVDDLLRVQKLRQVLADEEEFLKSLLKGEWRGEKTPFAEMLEVLQWLVNTDKSLAFSSATEIEEVLSQVREPVSDAESLDSQVKGLKTLYPKPLKSLEHDAQQQDIPLKDLRAILAGLTNTDRYHEWRRMKDNKQVAQSKNARRIITAIDKGVLEPASAVTEFEYACAEARWAVECEIQPKLNRIWAIDRHALANKFRELDKEWFKTVTTLILEKHFKQMPHNTDDGMALINRQIELKKRHMPIRKLVDKAGEKLQQIKPVLLMSPISVAQFLPPNAINFDILVIDEASQVKPEDAMGVIARAGQIVVVGDKKQLPPTSFFERMLSDDDREEEDDEVQNLGDMESILSLCSAQGLRTRMLEWHYRSQDPSLIQVSNAEFYGDRLILPPSPNQDDPDYGLKFRRVSGVYARGKTGLGRQGTNRIEADAIIDAIANHAENFADHSLGVVAFSKAQADLLDELLEMRRRNDDILNDFLRDDKDEPLFVKNIENVQGDERDVIMISVGYGPQESDGRLLQMNFGPINNDGGERRLNVLFSRAKIRCEVFASFDPDDIDLNRTTKDGPKILKRFLDFAKTGKMAVEMPNPTGGEADSPFEEDVARVIRDWGYIANHQVGHKGFRIDIGVSHKDRPSTYFLAVECDGATYHSGRWARERDRHRQDILEGLGWRFHRIWSTDWFENRATEAAKLKRAVHNAFNQSQTP